MTRSPRKQRQPFARCIAILCDTLLTLLSTSGDEQDINAVRESLFLAGATFDRLLDRAVMIEQSNLEAHSSAVRDHQILAFVIVASQTALAIGMATILGIRIGRSIAHPVQALQAAADRLGAGDLSTRVNIRAPGEIAGLASMFNTMAERLQGASVKAEAQNHALATEIERRNVTEARLRHDARHDALTGLANRALLLEELNRAIDRARRQEGYHFALLFLDLDRFKVINDSLGHHVGDALLQAVSSRLAKSVRSLDTIVRVEKEVTARLGGDEFAILLDGISNPARAVHAAERIQKEILAAFVIDEHEMRLSASIGIAIGDSRSEADNVLRDADTAMYRAKMARGAQHAMFDDVMHAEVKARLQLENDLRRAVGTEQLGVAYQPIVDLSTGQTIAFEALVRWQHPEQGMISPSKFIPMAEETGLIVPSVAGC